MSAVGATGAGRSPAVPGRAIRAALVPGPRARRRLIALAAITVLLAAGYLFWLRDSTLVQVRNVTVTGLGGTDSERIRAALGTTARTMTTLHVDRTKLERAAAAFPAVRGLEVRAEVPNGIRIHVLQHRPAALLVSGSRRVSVAGDGTVLSGLAVKGGLPQIRIAGAIPAKRVPDGAVLAAVRVADALPMRLRVRVSEVRRAPGQGVVVPLEGGPQLIFGDGTRVRAKWGAAVAVLAEREVAGAAYVDVRIPERPVAGGLPVETVTPVAPASVPGDPAAAGGASAAQVSPPAGTPGVQTPPPAAPAVPARPTAPAGGPSGQAGTPFVTDGEGPAGASPRTPAGSPAEGGGTVPNPQP